MPPALQPRPPRASLGEVHSGSKKHGSRGPAQTACASSRLHGSSGSAGGGGEGGKGACGFGGDIGGAGGEGDVKVWPTARSEMLRRPGIIDRVNCQLSTDMAAVSESYTSSAAVTSNMYAEATSWPFSPILVSSRQSGG